MQSWLLEVLGKLQSFLSALTLKEDLIINFSNVYYHGIRVPMDVAIILILSAFSLALFLIKKVSINETIKQVVKIYEIIIHKYQHKVIAAVVM